MDRNENRLANTIVGAGFGVLIGGGLGLCSSTLVLDDTLPFRLILGAALGGILVGGLGFFFGAGLVEWLKDHWWEFWH